jgi:YHS domain-containing protein
MRQIFILALLIALGYVISRLLFPRHRVPPTAASRTPGSAIEEMVQDPFCHLYLPRAEAIRQRIRGQDHYFCSPGCLEKFLATHS